MSERIEVKKSELPDDAFKKVSFSEGGMGPLIKEADMTHIRGDLARLRAIKEYRRLHSPPTTSTKLPPSAS